MSCLPRHVLPPFPRQDTVFSVGSVAVTVVTLVALVRKIERQSEAPVVAMLVMGVPAALSAFRNVGIELTPIFCVYYSVWTNGGA